MKLVDKGGENRLMKLQGKVMLLTLMLMGLAAFLVPEREKNDIITPVFDDGVYYPTANPYASEEARKLLRFLHEIKGSYTLSGQHNYLEEPTRHTRRIRAITGESPGLIGYEMGVILNHSEEETKRFRDWMVEDAKKTHQSGGFVTITYHAALPGECGCWEHVNNGGISEEIFEQILTPGTELHALWLADIDEAAMVLMKLRDANVPVLWRPYHEMNGKWFWWGGQREFNRLWELMFERYTEVHQLDNLLWVWSPSAPNAYAAPYEPYYVGELYADVLAVDVYYNDYKQSHHDQLWELAAGKPIALGEVGELPDPELLQGMQNQYVWFMAWGDELEGKNSRAKIKSLYAMDRVLNRSDLATFGSN